MSPANEYWKAALEGRPTTAVQRLEAEKAIADGRVRFRVLWDQKLASEGYWDKWWKDLRFLAMMAYQHLRISREEYTSLLEMADRVHSKDAWAESNTLEVVNGQGKL